MAEAIQTDFDISFNGAITGGGDGQAVLHSGLANPLTGEGVYCRLFRHTSGFNNHLLAYNAAFDSGNFVGIPDTKIISLRAWVRVQDGSASGAIGLIANTGAHTNNDNPTDGYMLSLGDWDGSSENQPLRLYLQTFASNTVVKTQTLDISAVNDTWYKIRLDVIPIAGVSDTLRAFTGTGATGSEVWVQQGTDTTVLTIDSDFAGWGGSRACGLRTRSQTGPPPYDAYVDRLQCLLTDVP